MFGAVARPASVPGCPHCVEPGEQACLLSGPVPAIEAGSLARYAAKALTTWGDVPAFPHEWWLGTRPAARAVEAAFAREGREPVLGLLADVHERLPRS
ncbi:hypothetical protein [Nonomuraea sp. NPDC049758]|uniref:hypothetical protein n=1 Tax=Nonomuraea sp. NPDC049758 TaxID=3154360 RepID=UPI00341EDACC